MSNVTILLLAMGTFKLRLHSLASPQYFVLRPSLSPFLRNPILELVARGAGNTRTHPRLLPGVLQVASALCTKRAVSSPLAGPRDPLCSKPTATTTRPGTVVPGFSGSLLQLLTRLLLGRPPRDMVQARRAADP